MCNNRKRKVFFGATGKFADLLPSIIKHNTEKYLVPMSDVHNDEIRNALDAKKIQHTEVVMYRTVSNDFTPEESLIMTCCCSSVLPESTR